MKKNTLTVAAIISIAAMLPMQSCIGNFNLTRKVLAWNNQVGNKFVNEIVFFAFWILPVYEVTSVADLLVLNSIEFWSGNNPLQASTKTVDTEQGRYYIACDDKGYTITAPNGDVVRLDFETDSNTWEVITEEGEAYPFMTIIDDNHVKMIDKDGMMRMVELSEQGVMAYSSVVSGSCLTQR
ncbi:MAG: DUF3332 domain-containing protein [Bacteroides sp.]|nr:DUF3332 domain-containing protein [Bacteroides sp.]